MPKSSVKLRLQSDGFECGLRTARDAYPGVGKQVTRDEEHAGGPPSDRVENQVSDQSVPQR